MQKNIPAWLSAVCVSAGLLGMTLPAHAHDHDNGPGQHEARQCQPPTSAEREAWAKRHIEQEANLLQINASQQSAWDVYAAAKLDLLKTIGLLHKPDELGEQDAATAARQHADGAAQLAQKLSVLADATDKLQAVLDPNQRKVLNRISRLHDFHAEPHGGPRGEAGWRHAPDEAPAGAPGAAKGSVKNIPKPKAAVAPKPASAQ